MPEKNVVIGTAARQSTTKRGSNSGQKLLHHKTLEACLK
jgi:hypothetical protein